MDLIIRKAEESDRSDLAACIAEGFEKDFSILCKDTKRVADGIKRGIHIDMFYVAQQNGEIIGVLAITDCNGRAVMTDGESYRKYFGFIKGMIAKKVLREEFEAPLKYPADTGYLEFVCVRKKARKRGVASIMIKESMKMSSYREYVLDVTDANEPAIQCYEKIGFQEFERVEEKHSKQKGYHAKIYMKYHG